MAKKAKTRRTAGKSTAKSARTIVRKAGKPKIARASALHALAVTARPSDEELDLRNRLKSGPRRQAGPPLTGDTPEPSRMRALRNEVIPEPTEPKGR